MNSQANKTQGIDFVIPWVDGNDPEWRKRKAAYTGEALTDDRDERYRDWDVLRFWFRTVEAYAPWVNRIWFICDQEPPEWLNREHPKLAVVRHEDYIPAEYLPTFSSHPIEHNLHRIPGLSERFVYFNDDMFLLRPLKPSFFFLKGLPRDQATLNPLMTAELSRKGKDAIIFTIPLNNTEYLNRDFSFRACVRKHPLKWLTLRYGKSTFRNAILMIWPRFVGFDEPHLPQAFLKSSFEKAWEQDGDILDATCRHAVRNDRDVNQWLIRYRQLAEGEFIPRRPVRNAVFQLEEKEEPWRETIRGQRKPMICLNDGPLPEDIFEQKKKELQEAFRAILPEKSAFEI